MLYWPPASWSKDACDCQTSGGWTAVCHGRPAVSSLYSERIERRWPIQRLTRGHTHPPILRKVLDTDTAAARGRGRQHSGRGTLAWSQSSACLQSPFTGNCGSQAVTLMCVTDKEDYMLKRDAACRRALGMTYLQFACIRQSCKQDFGIVATTCLSLRSWAPTYQ